MQENILAKARKLLALINHPSTGTAEKQAATYALDNICKKHSLTHDQLNSIQRSTREITYTDPVDDTMLIHQILTVVTESYDHQIYINKVRSVLISDLTDAEYAAAQDMLFHYRKEHLRIQQALDKSIKDLQKETRKKADEIRRIKKQTMRGIIHRNELFVDSEPTTPTDETRKLSKQETEDLMRAYQLTKGTAYKKPPTNLTTSSTTTHDQSLLPTFS